MIWLPLKGPAGQWGSRQEGVQKYLGNYNSLKWWVINIWWECRKWWIFIIWMCTTLSLFLISTIWRNCSIWWILIIWNVYDSFTFFKYPLYEGNLAYKGFHHITNFHFFIHFEKHSLQYSCTNNTMLDKVLIGRQMECTKEGCLK